MPIIFSRQYVTNCTYTFECIDYTIILWPSPHLVTNNNNNKKKNDNNNNSNNDINNNNNNDT